MEKIAYFAIGVGLFCSASATFYLGYRCFLKNNSKPREDLPFSENNARNIDHNRPEITDAASGSPQVVSPSSQSSFFNQPLAFFKSLVRKESGSPASRSARDRSSSELMQIMMELNATLARVRSERESINQQINEKFSELQSWQASRSEYKPEVVEQLAKEIDTLHRHLQAFRQSFALYPVIETNDKTVGDELSQYAKELEEHHATIKTAAKHFIDELDTCKKILEASGEYVNDVRLQ
ncbi:MAG: hypothetical protein JJT82_03570 [Legionellaceae bacterium]|nr:hypothetical protein [Legionellaceae bacterium]